MKLLVITISFLFSIPSFANEANWPKTLEEAVSEIVSSLPAEDRERVKNTEKADLIKFHHGWGTGIRNDFGLWQGNKALRESACGKPCHPDDASMIIIEAVWRKLNETP